MTLSLLLLGTQEDRLKWVFQLYDLNGDGLISREEMEDVAQSVGEQVLDYAGTILMCSGV